MRRGQWRQSGLRDLTGDTSDVILAAFGKVCYGGRSTCTINVTLVLTVAGWPIAREIYLIFERCKLIFANFLSPGDLGEVF